MRHLIYFMGYAMVKRLKYAALELRMLQVVMYNFCRIIANFFFYYRQPRSCPESV